MTSAKPSFWLSMQGMAALGLIGAVTYFLLMEHRAHVFALLPYLILLACPLMHIFMHRGHRHGHAPHQDDASYQQGLEEGRRQAEQEHQQKGHHHE